MAVNRATIEQAVEPFKAGLEADGARMAVGEIDESAVTINLYINEKTCRECLLPADRLEALFLQAIRDRRVDVSAVRVVWIEDH